MTGLKSLETKKNYESDESKIFIVMPLALQLWLSDLLLKMTRKSCNEPEKDHNM